MKGLATKIKICGKEIQLGDWVRVEYTTGITFKGGTISGKIIELWSPELNEGHLQARVESGWCFHNHDKILSLKKS